MGKRVNSAVWIEKYKRWQIKVQKDGVRKTFYSGKEGRAGQREANAKADEWLDEGIETAKRLTVESTSKLYMEELNLTTSKTHCIQYQNYFKNWINPKIGHIKIESLTEQHLQSVLNHAYSKGLAKKTLQNIRGCMLNWLKFCRKSKYTALFSESITIPKNAAVNERRILNPEDIQKLFTSDNTTYRGKTVSDIYVNAYRFQVTTGLRPGELIGLQWNDIKKDIVTLKRAVNVYGETTRGKNDNARRSFKLTPLAQQILKQQKETLEESGIKASMYFQISAEALFVNRHIINVGANIETTTIFLLRFPYMNCGILLYL